MLRREELRLRALFHSLLLASAAAAPLACSKTDDAGSPDGSALGAEAGGSDATSHDGNAPGDDATLSDSAGDDDAGGDATPDGPDFGYSDAACNPQYLDGAGDGGPCQYYMGLPCGLPPEASTEQCNLGLGLCGLLCESYLGHPCAITECLAQDAGADAFIPQGVPLTLECATGSLGCGAGVGRRPDGLADAACHAGPCGDAVGAWLADVARLEAASVIAFRRLRAELLARGAPRELVRGAERSARDEVRHARVTSRLARRRGAKPARVVTRRASRGRSLEAFAIENAVEGCVRETFGALVATRQAARAEDRDVARAMERIARDETRHAALAWSVASWLETRLDDGARARVRRAMKGAIASLRCEAAAAAPDAARALGLARGPDAKALVDAFAASILG